MSEEARQFGDFLEFIRARAGLIFPDSRLNDVRAVVHGIRTSLKLRDLAALQHRLETDNQSLDELVAEITIGETYFYRDPGQFEILRTLVLPELLARPEAGPVRAWSAACSTGEEAYSIATVLCDAGSAHRASVLGTDISRPRLKRAVSSRYRTWSLRGVPPGQAAAVFNRTGDEYEVKSHYRRIVSFGYLNLADDAYPSIATGVWGMDVIFCRNVLIYLDPDTVARTAQKLLDSLSDDGWLFLGASDPAISEMVDCETIITEAGLVYRRKQKSRLLPEMPSPVYRVETPPPTPPAPAAMVHPPVELPPMEPDRSLEEVLCGVRALADRGHIDAALKAADASLVDFPASAELIYMKGLLHYERLEHDVSLEVVRRALYLDRGHILAHVLMGNLQKRLDRPSAARRSFENAAHLLSTLPPDSAVHGTDGDTAGRLNEMIRLQLSLLGDVT